MNIARLRILQAVLLASCISGALASRGPSSSKDLASIRHLGVVSMIGGAISGVSKGLSPFDRQYLHVTPGWGIDDTVEAAVTKRLRASGLVRSADVEVLALPRPGRLLSGDRRHPIDLKSLAALGRDAGLEAVIAVIPEQPADRADLPAGISLNRRRVIGGSADVRTCAAVRIVLVRVLDGMQLADASPTPCSRHGESLPWHAAWADYSEQEIAQALAALERQTLLVVAEGLAELGIESGYRPGHRVRH